MLNFLFEGAIGELLAPVSSPFHQLQLAIQRHENEKVYELLTTGGIDPGGIGEKTGLAPIHYAAKYNNRSALELVLSRGVQVNQVDKGGNTALHHAAAGGHFDLVQFLIGQGAAPAARNQAGKTAYDISSNILVSQFLMPLQLAAEQDDSGVYNAPPPPVAPNQSYTGAYSGGYTGYSNLAQPSQLAVETLASSSTMMEPVPLPSPTAGGGGSASFMTVPAMSSAAASGHVGAYPSTWTSSGMTAAPAVTPAATSTSTTSAGGGVVRAAVTNPASGTRMPVAATPSGSRVIRPDGFHSSATDPALQEKYGHTKQIKVTAPPPTGGPGAPTSYHMFNPQAPQPSLYVPYDFQSTPTPHSRTSPPPPAVGRYAAPVVAPLSEVPASSGLPAAHSHHSPPPAQPAPSPTHRSSSTGQASTPLVHLNVFNPAADNVVSASSNSSAVL